MCFLLYAILKNWASGQMTTFNNWPRCYGLSKSPINQHLFYKVKIFKKTPEALGKAGLLTDTNHRKALSIADLVLIAVGDHMSDLFLCHHGILIFDVKVTYMNIIYPPKKNDPTKNDCVVDANQEPSQPHQRISEVSGAKMCLIHTRRHSITVANSLSEPHIFHPPDDDTHSLLWL